MKNSRAIDAIGDLLIEKDILAEVREEVDTIWDLVHRNTAREPAMGYGHPHCPACGTTLPRKNVSCSVNNCRQHIDWSRSSDY